MWFIQNKQNLVASGALRGMIDHHSHLLWGVDDGSKTEEHTRKMILGLQAMGISGGFATPHIMAGLPLNTPNTLRTAFQQRLAPLCAELGFSMQLASEYMLDEAFLSKLNHSEKPLTYDGKHLLIEMSHLSAPASLHELIFEIAIKGYIPVLAHPERYSFMTIHALENLKDRGCKFQLNLLSLSDRYYHKSSHQMALALLDSDLYDFVGTDAHTETMVAKIGTLTCKPKQIQTIEKVISHAATNS